MGKKVFVVPPQQVSVNVSVNVGQQIPTQQAPPPQEPVQAGQIPQQPVYAPAATNVSTSVQVGAPAWGDHPTMRAVPAGPYQPPFRMPTSDVLRRTIPKLGRQNQNSLGDHVHTPACAETGCALLHATLPTKVAFRPWAMLGWLLVAACVWVFQYSLIVPLAWLGAVATSDAGKVVGWFLILLCGFGPFYALYYLCAPAVPRQALIPWGLNGEAAAQR